MHRSMLLFLTAIGKGAAGMADYHLSAKIIGRSSGRSATAAAAYRAAERIFDRRTGIEHDYSRKQGVVRDEVLLPRDAPELYRDRGELWNAVEAAETRSNSRLSREFELARGWAERELVSRGMCADEREHTPERDRAYIDCRSYAARGIDREPIRHEGPAVRAMESRERERCAAEGREYAPVTDRARENEQIMERNALVERPSGII